MPGSSGPPTEVPGPRHLDLPLGVRCARCYRYLFPDAGVRRSVTGRWRHRSCETAPEPSEADFTELAALLMERHPWPRAQALLGQLADVDEELAEIDGDGIVGLFPRQAGPPTVEDLESVVGERKAYLVERGEDLRAAIEWERSWKADKLAAEWSDGV
jgi:hypothetical protein